MREHNYLYLAPDENVPFMRHKRRPGKQSQLTKPRDTTRALTKCKVTRPDGSTYFIGDRKPRTATNEIERRQQRQLAQLRATDDRKRDMLAKVQAQSAELDHWSS